MLEKNIEKHFRNEIKKIKGEAFKFRSPGNNGVPDRLVLYRGKSYFVELKQPGKKFRPLQRTVSKKFRALGFKVYVIDSYKKVGEFIDEICTT